MAVAFCAGAGGDREITRRGRVRVGTVGGQEDGADGLGALDDSGRYPGAFGFRGELDTHIP